MNEGGWLSTRNKTKVTQPSGRGIKKKRSSTVKPLRNVKLSLDDSPPPRQLFTATKQSSLNDFFTSNKDYSLENEVHMNPMDFNDKDHASKLSQDTESDDDLTVQKDSKEESCERSDCSRSIEQHLSGITSTSIEQHLSGRTSNTGKSTDTEVNSSDDAGMQKGDLDFNFMSNRYSNVFKQLKKASSENDLDMAGIKNEERSEDGIEQADMSIVLVGEESTVVADKITVDKKQKYILKRLQSSSSESDGDCEMFPKRFKDSASCENEERINSMSESRNINYENHTICRSKCDLKRNKVNIENSPASAEIESQIVFSIGKQQGVLDDIHLSYFDKHSLDLGSQMSQDNLLGNEPEIELVFNIRKFDQQRDKFSSGEEKKTRKQGSCLFKDSPSFVSNTQVKNFLSMLDKENITFGNADEDNSVITTQPNNLKLDEESPTCRNNTVYTPLNNTQIKNFVKHLDGKDITFSDSSENTPVILGDTQIALLQDALETSSLRLSSQSQKDEEKI